MTKKTTPASQIEALKQKAEELKNEIRQEPGFDKNINLMYAHREAGNLVHWLNKN